MGTILKLTESQMKLVINSVINEGGKRGQYKEVWNFDDQTLAMYNSRFSIEDLGISKDEVAEVIIGSSVGSFVQQSSNFDYLDGKNGLDRPNETQTAVFEKYKGYPQSDLKTVCLNILDERLENPEESVTKMKIAKEIGMKRDERARSREDAIRKSGRDPKKLKLLKIHDTERELDPDDDSENASIIDNPSQKNDIQQHIEKMYNIAMKIKSTGDISGIDDLISNLEFLDEYSGLSESRIRRSLIKNLRNL
jgi:hypothetical protein